MIGKRVLLIDDDVDFLTSAVRTFEQNGAKTITAIDAMEGLGKLFTHDPDLVILSILLAGMDGFQVCQRIRQFSNTPLIMLSALDQDQHMLQGLEAGADDVLSKSVSLQVLSARAKAVIRRNQRTGSERTGRGYDDGRLVINVENHSVRIENRPVRLTQTEFRLLVFLLRNEDKVLSFKQILFHVWGRECSGNEAYVYVYISHLRNKLEPDPKRPRYIQTVYGVGYTFEKQNVGAA